MSTTLDFEDLATRAGHHAELLQLFCHHGLDEAARVCGGENLERALGGTALGLLFDIRTLEELHNEALSEVRAMAGAAPAGTTDPVELLDRFQEFIEALSDEQKLRIFDAVVRAVPAEGRIRLLAELESGGASA